MRLAALLFILFTAACTKSRMGGEVIRGKMIRNLCVDPLIQVLDSNYFHLGENWLDTFQSTRPGGMLYKNVFTVSNPCSAHTQGIAEGDTVQFRLYPNPPGDCAVCAMYVVSPGTRHSISIE